LESRWHLPTKNKKHDLTAVVKIQMAKGALHIPLALLSITMDGCKISSQHTSPELKPSGVLAFLTTRDGNFEVYSMEADGKNVVNLTNNMSMDFWSSWSSDGKYILFYSNRDGNNEIYKMNADGSNPINLSNHPSNDLLPAWSRDGQQIVFTSDRDHKSGEVYKMKSDGTGIVRLTHNDSFEEVPTWSSDGSTILFTKEVNDPADSTNKFSGEIFTMDQNGNNEKRLTFKKGFDSGARFSPDGKRIAFYGPNEEKNPEIFVMNADGSDIINLTQDPLEDYSPSWSPDGSWIAYTSGTRAQYDVWVIHVATRTKIRLTQEPTRNESPVWRP
jgi:TolB protein